MDFTIQKYQYLLKQLIKNKYAFQTFESFIESPQTYGVILRHDVDRLPENALEMAKIEYELGITASYYFRVVEKVWSEEIIRKVSDLGHEIAYHYEDLSLKNGDYSAAIEHFSKQLNRFREIYPSKTICMHGSPLSSWDNRKLWEKYDYRDFGIIAEPYFEVNYDDVFYITDTGRKWNNESVSVRDKVQSGFDIQINSTQHMIQLFQEGVMPDKMMINTHPHRWHNNNISWLRELVFQNLKNIVKYFLIKSRS